MANNLELETDDDVAALLEQVRRGDGESASVIAKSRSLRRQAWEGLAGGDLEPMLRSREVAAEYLKHPDPKLRQTALSVLTSHWQPTLASTQECERLEREDPDPDVRKTARSCLTACYSKLDDPRLSQVFARIVMDESDSLDSRISAYDALFLIRGLPADTWPGTRMRQGELRFPEDVDWSLVESCLRSARVA